MCATMMVSLLRHNSNYGKCDQVLAKILYNPTKDEKIKSLYYQMGVIGVRSFTSALAFI